MPESDWNDEGMEHLKRDLGTEVDPFLDQEVFEGMFLVRPTEERFQALKTLYGEAIWTFAGWQQELEVTDPTKVWMMVDRYELLAFGTRVNEPLIVAEDAVPVKLVDPVAYNLGTYIYQETVWVFRTEHGYFMPDELYEEQCL